MNDNNLGRLNGNNKKSSLRCGNNKIQHSLVSRGIRNPIDEVFTKSSLSVYLTRSDE